MNYLTGYVTSRSFYGIYMPVPAQNSCLREYCQRNNFIYILPPLESYYDNCYHQLFGLLNDLDDNSNVVMYSLLMLPINDSNKLNLLNSIANHKKIKFHFVLENFNSFIDEIKFKDEVTNYFLNDLKCNINTIGKYL